MEKEIKDILDCHGKGNYGVGAIAGKDKELQAHVPEINPKALYTH